ncbi:o-succinylbenzoate--CoA ligase [Angustibacter aerolatus]
MPGLASPSRTLRPVALDALDPEAAVAVVAAALDGTGDALLPVPADGAAGLDALRPGTPLAPGEDDEHDPTALVVATSGSTGDAKGAVLPASALRHSATATLQRLGGPATWLLALPAHHVAGVQVLVRSALADRVPVRLGPGPFTPAAFEAATGLLRGRTCTALVPTQLVRLLDAGGSALAALASFDAVLVGGAATPPALLDRARAAGVRVVTTYGSSETSGGCVYDGAPLDGVRVELADGVVRLGGPTIARGYRPAHPGVDVEDGVRWFTTNDLGRWDGDRLVVLGRADDVLVTGGEKVAPQAVEAVLSQVPGVAESLVVGVPDPEWGQRVVALVVPSSSGPPALDVVRDAVRERLGPHAAPRALLVVDALPSRGIGKPDRAAATALAASRPSCD